MDLKATLNLPDADFTIPMKADLSTREPEMQRAWKEQDLYGAMMEARKDDPTFVLHDGPPYTNGPVHLGTSLNKILKDFSVKSRTIMGFRAPYVPGYDNHGLPIELAVQKKFSDQKITPTLVELRRACREHAETYIKVQTEQFQRLGIFGMWDRPYTSMDFRFEAEIIRVFKRLVEGGYVYRGLRPTLWSPTSRTALADTEIVYHEHKSTAIDVKFPLLRDPDGVFAGLDNLFGVIWTTTPWTIPANLAVAFHPEFQYAVVESGGERYLLLEDLVERTMERIGRTEYSTVKRVPGAALENVVFKHPVFERDSIVVMAGYVTTEDGTGVVHTAPGHGRDDFFTGQKYGLPVLCPVDERGVLTEEAGEFAGTHYKKCDEVVTNRLDELGMLLHREEFHHSYPHAERDGQPVIFRATEQWFISMEHQGLRQRMLEQIERTEWFPASGKARITSMIANRPDWCISRQRPWGVGIPIFYGAKTGEPVLDPAAIESVAQMVEKHGSDAWYEREPAEILPSGYEHPATGEDEFRKEVDVFDVWFDSGSTSLCVLEGNVEPRWKEHWPADLYSEGSDQHRGWFNVSLIIATALKGEAPYLQVVTHGFVTDEKGLKMSKSLGNVIDPMEVCDKYGADVLRLWVASVDYEHDVPCSDRLLQVAGESYRRIRNTLRFLLGNLYDFDPAWSGEMLDLDKWALDFTRGLAKRVLRHYERYEYNSGLQAIHNACVNELSSFYLDAIKDRMYCDGKDWDTRRSAQAACHGILHLLVRLLATILPHTAEEVYSRLLGVSGSVHLARIQPEELVTRPNEAFADRIAALLEVRSWVFTQFEPWKAVSAIKDSQDVAMNLTSPEDEYTLLSALGADLPNYFRAAEVTLTKGPRKAEFLPSAFLKCERSRLRRADVEPVRLEGRDVPLSARDRRALGV